MRVKSTFTGKIYDVLETFVDYRELGVQKYYRVVDICDEDRDLRVILVKNTEDITPQLVPKATVTEAPEVPSMYREASRILRGNKK